MTKIQKEADAIVHLMRQSKMDKVRTILERWIKTRNGLKSKHLKECMASNINTVKELFEEASSNAQWP